jgi:muramoyltetrapeptide carboxypeptidase LdcA involved in peptidoglycan recycling
MVREDEWVRRPPGLLRGDTVAVLSPSWGGPAAFARVFDHGLAVLRRWGLEVKEYPGTRAAAAGPRERALELMAAFADPDVHGIITSIGGEDSIRLLPYLDAEVIAAHPKILLGFSDTTTILTFMRLHGLVGLYGPSVMAGFAQMDALPGFEAHVHDMLFDGGEVRGSYDYAPYAQFCEGYPDWGDPAQVGRVHPLQPAEGARVVQGAGRGRVRGQLFGGCLEVLDWLKGTAWWPRDPAFWDGKLVFIETSEEKPSPDDVKRSLRNYGVQGVFERAAGLLFGRARDYSAVEKHTLEAVIRGVVAEEFECPELTIVANLDFGHTDPQWVLPIGVDAEVDLDAGGRLRLVEPWLSRRDTRSSGTSR